MRTEIYARVSTDKKDHQNQMPELLACNPVLQFVDYATGKNSDREQFQAMLRAAERHEFDELVVWSLDRLTREGTLSTLLILDKFPSWASRFGRCTTILAMNCSFSLSPGQPRRSGCASPSVPRRALLGLGLRASCWVVGSLDLRTVVASYELRA
jgi:hypothetical protein